jgi:DNA replication and repair protein RecF
MAKAGGAGVWAVAATVRSAEDTISIGTGLTAESGDRAGRVVRINGETQSGAGALADRVEMLWVTPAMDGLFRGPASDRRRFLDRLVVSFDPSYRTRIGHFERAMRQRNRLLDDGVRDGARFDGLEMIMAEAGVAIAAARAEAVNGIEAMIAERRARAPDSPFPWAHLRLEGTLEQDLAHLPAVDVEDGYVHALQSGRERDRAAGRTLEGPHRSDLMVAHGPKAMPAHVCSTGEQKALLIGLVLAHAELEKRRRDGAAPILLLDEVAAHLDKTRRDALYAEIVQLGSQAWMTGTDESAFDGIVDDAQFIRLAEPALGAA